MLLAHEQQAEGLRFHTAGKGDRCCRKIPRSVEECPLLYAQALSCQCAAAVINNFHMVQKEPNDLNRLGLDERSPAKGATLRFRVTSPGVFAAGCPPKLSIEGGPSA
jgi:hypothetical protein